MNEKRIQQVLDIEQQARAVYESAVEEAKRLPDHAEQESQAMLQRAREEAEREAKQVIQKAQGEEESAQIMAQAEEKVRRMDNLAHGNFDRAVSDVLYRVVGKE